MSNSRFALTRGPLRTIRAYLPDNYAAAALEPDALGSSGPEVLISGEDVAGWTLDGYVIPRLASGLYFAREVSADEATDAIIAAEDRQ